MGSYQNKSVKNRSNYRFLKTFLLNISLRRLCRAQLRRLPPVGASKQLSYLSWLRFSLFLGFLYIFFLAGVWLRLFKQNIHNSLSFLSLHRDWKNLNKALNTAGSTYSALVLRELMSDQYLHLTWEHAVSWWSTDQICKRGLRIDFNTAVEQSVSQSAPLMVYL